MANAKRLGKRKVRLMGERNIVMKNCLLLALRNEINQITSLCERSIFDIKEAKHQITNGNIITKYAGAFEYDQSYIVTRVGITNVLAFINNGNIAYKYYHKDHLGNVRQVVEKMEMFFLFITNSN